MPVAEVNGAKMYYEIAGAGNAVVFLHAGIADSRMWDEQFAHFAEQYRVLRYDLRGFGQTTSPAMPYAHHDDLHTLFDRLGIQRAALIGCSNGGRVAMNFALAYPDRVSALVMVCSSPGGFKFQGESPALWKDVVAAFESGDMERTSRLEAQLWAAGPDRDPAEVDAKMLDLVYEMNLLALRNEVAGNGEEQSFAPPAVERLAELRAPTLLMVGELDSPVVLEAGKLMQAQISGAKRVDMPAAHLPSMERPDEFNRIVIGFLDDTRS